MIRLKNEKDLDFLRISGRILAKVLRELKDFAREGVKLTDLDRRARKIIAEAGAKPAFLDYKPTKASKAYPAAICTSLNDQVVHGIPTDYILKSGDILKIDAGVNYRGYFTDAAITVAIGKISREALQLIDTTKAALEKAIQVSIPGNRLGDIGAVIEKTAKAAGLSVVKGLTGHGVGFELHEEPTVYNFGKEREGMELKPGLVLAIEPMFVAGKGDVFEAEDGSFIAKDGSLTAHFEHTIYIGTDGPEVLTNYE